MKRTFHFLFLFFRAFHSPSWEAKLPISSFTFLFLSASLRDKQTIEIHSLEFSTKQQQKVCSLPPVATSPPAHDLLERLASQEARVLPDLPQGALVLPLELVLQTLPLLLLPCVAALLPVIQPARTERMISVSGNLFISSLIDSLCCFYLHLHHLGREELERNRLLLVENQARVCGGNTTDFLQDLPVKLLHREHRWKKKINTYTKVQQKPWKSHRQHPPVEAQEAAGLEGAWRAALWLAGRCAWRRWGLCRAGSTASQGPGRWTDTTACQQRRAHRAELHNWLRVLTAIIKIWILFFLAFTATVKLNVPCWAADESCCMCSHQRPTFNRCSANVGQAFGKFIINIDELKYKTFWNYFSCVFDSVRTSWPQRHFTKGPISSQSFQAWSSQTLPFHSLFHFLPLCRHIPSLHAARIHLAEHKRKLSRAVHNHGCAEACFASGAACPRTSCCVKVAPPTRRRDPCISSERHDRHR